MSASTEIPQYIKAKNEDELIRKMVENNFKHSCGFKYFDIQKRGKFWYAWYVKDIRDQLLRKATNGSR